MFVHCGNIPFWKQFQTEKTVVSGATRLLEGKEGYDVRTEGIGRDP